MTNSVDQKPWAPATLETMREVLKDMEIKGREKTPIDQNILRIMIEHQGLATEASVKSEYNKSKKATDILVAKSHSNETLAKYNLSIQRGKANNEYWWIAMQSTSTTIEITREEINTTIREILKQKGILISDTETDKIQSQNSHAQGVRRSKTISLKKLSRINALTEEEDDDDDDDDEILSKTHRPRTRGDCKNTPRPCPWAGCKYHLYLDVSPKTGSIKLNFPNLKDPSEMPADRSCVLDVADKGDITLEDAGKIMNMTRERIRQMEANAIKRTKRNPVITEYGALIASEHVCKPRTRVKDPDETKDPKDPDEFRKTPTDLTLEAHMSLALAEEENQDTKTDLNPST